MPSSDVCSSDRKSTRLNSSHTIISYAVFCLKKKSVVRSEEHTSELQSHDNLVCRLLLDENTTAASARCATKGTLSPGVSRPARPRRLFGWTSALGPRPGQEVEPVRPVAHGLFFHEATAPDIAPLSLPPALPI